MYLLISKSTGYSKNSNRITKWCCKVIQNHDCKMGWKIIWSSPSYSPTQPHLYSYPRTSSLPWASHKARATSTLVETGIKKEKKTLENILVFKKNKESFQKVALRRLLEVVTEKRIYSVFIKMYTALTECLNTHKYLPGKI